MNECTLIVKAVSASRPPLAEYITEEFRQRVPFSVFTTNPCRCVCVCERERERERESVCERGRASVCVCERERERECVYVCERERERVCVRERERECV